MNQHRHIFALLGIGAFIFLVYLLRRSHGPASNGAVISDNSVASPPEYPSVAPIKLGNVEIGGSPINLVYNTLPGGGRFPQVGLGDGQSGDCPCNVDPCYAAQTLVSKNVVPPDVFERAAANFRAYQDKLVGLVTARPQESAEGVMVI